MKKNKKTLIEAGTTFIYYCPIKIVKSFTEPVTIDEEKLKNKLETIVIKTFNDFINRSR